MNSGTHSHSRLKHPEQPEFKIITMMMGKCYPTFSRKSHYSHIFPFFFFFIHLSQVDSMLFICFLKFPTFWEAWRYVLFLIFVFLCGQLSHWKNTKTQPKPLLSLPFFYSIVLRSKSSPYAVNCCEVQVFLSWEVSFYLLLCCIF